MPHSYAMYHDCTNLYGKSMCMKLPLKDFCWHSEEEIKSFDIHNTPENGDIGYVMEVDLEYPPELHDYHNDYPLAPEKREIHDEMLSPYTKCLLEHLKQKRVPTTKLIASVENKTKYILDYRALKLYIRLGLRVAKIHKILSFFPNGMVANTHRFQYTKKKTLLVGIS